MIMTHSLIHSYLLEFIEVFFPRVADQVLTDQVKSLIQGLCKNLSKVAATYDLTKHASVKHINGELLLVNIVNTLF